MFLHVFITRIKFDFRAKKLQKQNEKLQLQLNEAKSIARELRSQIIEADEFKVGFPDRLFLKLFTRISQILEN